MALRDWIELCILIATVIGGIVVAVWVIPNTINSAIDKVVTKLAETERQIYGRVETVEREARDGRTRIHQKIDGNVSSLDAKYNGLRDNIDIVKRDYARRDDLEGAVDRVERALGETREAISELGDRMDRGLSEFTKTVTQLALSIAAQRQASAGD